MMQGAFVGYREVGVTSQDAQASGKSIYTFTSAYEHPDQGGTGFPFASRTSYDYQRGLPLSETHYKYTGGQYVPVSQTLNVYSSATFNTETTLPGLDGWKIGYSRDNAVYDTLDCFAKTVIHYRAGAMYLTQSEQRSFASTAGGIYAATTTRYRYGNAAFPHPTSVETQVGVGRATLSRQRYTFDYDTLAVNPANSMALALRLLRRRHALLPVEQQVWKIEGADTTLTSASLTLFGPNLLPSTALKLSTLAPVLSLSYLPSSLSNGSFSHDIRLQPAIIFDQYDTLGNPVQWHKPNGTSNSYLWDCQGSQLIAEVKNAPASQTAFTSFEPNATGRWQYDSANVGNRYVPTHFTGTRAYQLDGTASGALRRPGLAAGEYELWFWSHGANAPQVSGATQQYDEDVLVAGPWHQHRVRLSLPANATVQVNSAPNQFIWIDEVRLHPVGAQMTTYTHYPLVGPTSQTDPAGRTVTYEYDALGRLQRARDEQGRVLTEQQYHYARP